MADSRPIAAITGGGRGIGKNIADLFVKTHAVIRIDRNADDFNADLSSPGAARELIDQIKAKHGRLDVLVNNARSSCRNLLMEETEDDWDHEMAVNLKSAYFLAKYGMELMGPGSSIVNIGSVTTNFVSHESAAYQISKGACLQLTRVLAFAGAKKGIRANCILPGFIVQDEYQPRYQQPDNTTYRQMVESIHPIGRPGSSDEIAEIAVFLASPAASFITGASIVADGGLTIQELAAFNYKAMRR